MSPDDPRAAVVAGLVAERYTPSPRPPQYQPTHKDTLPAITEEQAAHNRAQLLAALDENSTVIDLRDRQTA